MPWTSISLNPPPAGITLFVQYGGSIFFAAKTKWSDKWLHLHNGTETEIEEPEFWWSADPNVGEEKVIAQTKGQLTFDL